QEQSLNRVGQVCFVRRRLKLGPIVRQPLSQAAPLQHGRKALHRQRPTLLPSLHRAISRRSYDQLGALKPVLVPALPRQPLHDLPPKWSAGGLADHDETLPVITAISWHSKSDIRKRSRTMSGWRERPRLRWRRSLSHGDGGEKGHNGNWKRLSMSTTVLAYVILFMGFITFLCAPK